ncbi:MAG: sensor histidine kinase [Saprospiraceae bacterium]
MKKQIILLFHFGYWSFYLAMLLIAFFVAEVGHFTAQHFLYFLGIGSCFVLLPSILGFYFSYCFLFKKYLQARKLLSLASYSLGGIVLIAMASTVGITLIFGKDFMFKDGYQSFLSEILLIAIIGIINGIIGFILKGFISWYDDLKIKEALQQQTHTMELELIKSKLDPHFLFNTINNIDGMMLKDVNVASKYLDKLSKILRFMLYEPKVDKIPLTKEVEYIQQYIDLQKIRTTNPDFVKYTVEGLHFKHQIPAMLFVPFIENAFKHVVSKKHFNTIEIHLLVAQEKIIFQCKNKYNPTLKTSKEAGGVGNELIEKRLQLLYPNRHQLQRTTTDGIYSIQLTYLTIKNYSNPKIT